MKSASLFLNWSFIGALSVFALPSNLCAEGGDSIRAMSPMTALILDARAGNLAPMKKAYEKGLDFFLDVEAPIASSTRALWNLREAGRLIEAGDYTTAQTRMSSIDRSLFPDEYVYLSGVLDAAQKRYETALESFRDLIDRRFEISDHLSNLAFMGAARIFHEVGDYKQAIYHYNQIRQLEPEFFEAVFEKAWSNYQDGDMNGALGVTLSFLSPFFDDTFYPEAFVVRAAAFYQLCYFDRANLTVQQYRKDYEPLLAYLKDLQQRDPQNWLFDENFMKHLKPRIRGALVGDKTFRAELRALLALKSEKHGARSANYALTQQAIAVVQGEMIRDARRVLQKSQALLEKTLSQMEIIGIEVLQRQANVLLGSKEEDMPVKTINLNDVDFDGLVQFWNFKGEWWVDELGSYYYGLKANCGQ